MAAFMQQDPQKPAQPKDLINLRNPKNGEVYRFSCRTCIDGHRAPLCSPIRHRGKVMYRRPNPGRPARQCGHPKSVSCDCLAKRTLCCTLTEEEWDRVADGYIIAVPMYDTLQELEAAHNARILMNASPKPLTPPPEMSMDYVSPTSDLSGWPTTSFGENPVCYNGSQMSDDPLHWTEPKTERYSDRSSSIDTPVSTSDRVPVRKAMWVTPQQPRTTSNASQFGEFQVNIESRPQRPAEVPRNHSLSSLSGDVHGRPSVKSEPDPDASVAALQRLAMDLELSQMTPAMQQAYMMNTPGYLQGNGYVDLTRPPRAPSAAMHMEPTFLETLPSRPLIAPPGPSQSCCSKKKVETREENIFSSWAFPPSAPLQQFPCPSCASTLCQCADCPVSMQSFDFNGAWSQACGRMGHMENPFPSGYAPPELAIPNSGTSSALFEAALQAEHEPMVWDNSLSKQSDFDVGMAGTIAEDSRTVNPSAIFTPREPWH